MLYAAIINYVPFLKRNFKSKKLSIFENGQKKLSNELDVVKLLRSVRLSKILFNSTLTTRQKILLSF